MTVPPPFAMLAEVTHRCPMRCVYCSNPLALEPASKELDTDTWRRVLDEAADLGVLQVHFSGGLPIRRGESWARPASGPCWDYPCAGLKIDCSVQRWFRDTSALRP